MKDFIAVLESRVGKKEADDAAEFLGKVISNRVK